VWYKGFYLPKKSINRKGDAMSRIVTEIVSCENQIHQFFLNQKIVSLLKRSNINKEKGIAPVAVFRMLFTTVFTGKNLFRTLESSDGTCCMAKDTVYRFLNSVHANWRRLLLLLSSRMIGRQIEPLTGAATMKVLIVDDTLYRRNRSKRVELLSRVFDHIDKRYYRGFRMLVLGWSDGLTFLPVSFSLLSSSKERHRYVPSRSDIDRRTNGAKRRQEGIRKATDVLVELVAQAMAEGIRAGRQAGSTLKPFLYELAIERKLLTAASLIEDAPLQIATPTGLYVPENYGSDYLGAVSVRTALSSSLNIPAVRTLLLVGVEPFVERLKKLGFDSIREEPYFYGYSAALGSIDISLFELVNAYRTMANGGQWTELQFIPGARSGKSRRMMNPDAAFIISSILADRESRSATFGLENFLSTRFWTAVKTGTSKDMRDNWCIGYSGKYTVGVWIGNFSGEPMWNVTGISGAAPVWLEIMNILHGDEPSRAPKPTPGVLAKAVQFKGGIEQERHEWFIKGSEPEIAVALNTRHEKPSIIYPAGGSIITIDPDIPEENQRVSFQAQPGGRKFAWRLNERSISAGMMSSFLWKPERGSHVLTITDQEHHVLDSVTFVVR
jgi:hypothetical protein